MLLDYRTIEFKILDPRIGTEFPIPAYAKPGDAGMDLCACIDEPIRLLEGQTDLIPTGLAVWIHDHNIMGLVMPRSGLGHKKGLVLGNGTGIIDSEYQGQIFVSANNRNHRDPRVERSIIINPGDKIAQLLFVPVLRVNFRIVDEFVMSERGDGGFGHTGI